VSHLTQQRSVLYVENFVEKDGLVGSGILIVLLLRFLFCHVNVGGFEGVWE